MKRQTITWRRQRVGVTKQLKFLSLLLLPNLRWEKLCKKEKPRENECEKKRHWYVEEEEEEEERGYRVKRTRRKWPHHIHIQILMSKVSTPLSPLFSSHLLLLLLLVSKSPYLWATLNMCSNNINPFILWPKIHDPFQSYLEPQTLIF